MRGWVVVSRGWHWRWLWRVDDEAFRVCVLGVLVEVVRPMTAAKRASTIRTSHGAHGEATQQAAELGLRLSLVEEVSGADESAGPQGGHLGAAAAQHASQRPVEGGAVGHERLVCDGGSEGSSSSRREGGERQAGRARGEVTVEGPEKDASEARRMRVDLTLEAIMLAVIAAAVLWALVHGWG